MHQPDFPPPPMDEYQVYLDVNISYATMAMALKTEAAAKELDLAGRKFSITDLKIAGREGGQIVAGLYFRGFGTGVFYLKGTPQYQPESQEVSFTGIVFQIKSESILIRSLAWLFRDRILRMIHDKAKYNIAGFLDAQRERLQSLLVRDISPRLRSESTVDGISVAGIYPGAESLLIRITAVGCIHLSTGE